MNEAQQVVAERLRRIAKELTDIVSALTDDKSNEAPTFPEWAAELVKQRKCLRCREDVPKGTRYRRGLDDKHWQEIWERTIKTGKVTEEEAIAAGMIAPAGELISMRDDAGISRVRNSFPG